jgi:cytochrome c2
MLYRSLFAIFALGALAAPEFLTYDNRPMGSADQALIIRTYLPNPGLDKEVTAHHGVGLPSPSYSAGSGLLSSSKNYSPIHNIPAGIAVNAGAALSYVWDTTECRLLYAWANGFLDMQPHWGTPESGRRDSRNYGARLIGQLFYKAKGKHPLQINGKAQSAEIRYGGNSRKSGHPIFRYAVDGRTISLAISAGDAPQTLVLHYRSSEADSLGYADSATPFEVLDTAPGSLRVLIRPNAAETHRGFKPPSTKVAEASVEAGEKLYNLMGCVACHTLDGGKNHGPSFKGLFGNTRPIAGTQVQASDDYLRESITNPGAKTVDGFPANMMPPYLLDDKQVESLILYIKTIK